MSELEKIFKSLNEPQKRAVFHKKGPLLVLAGAGSGKTRVIAYRILNLIHQGVEPNKILAITFTNKAASEMQERVGSLLKDDPLLNFPISGSIYNPSYQGPFISTFHSLCVYILREKGREIGIKKSFHIADKEDSTRILKSAIKAAGFDTKQFEPRKIGSIISRAKGRLITESQFAESAEEQYIHRVTSLVWEKYEKALEKESLLDFDDLILKTVLLLQQNKEVREFYQKKWTYVHIDEYQDTNAAQYTLSRLLAGPEKNICVVGDNDQSIYGWRGADFKNLMNFSEDFGGAEQIILEENYRSTKNILDIANNVIKENVVRIEKNLFTKKGNGEKAIIHIALNEQEESYFVADTIETIIKSKNKEQLSEIAVLYRANFQSRILEEALLTRSIPYLVLGTRFYQRKEIKDILAYIRVALEPDDTASYLRAINIPARGIGKVTQAKIVGGQKKLLPKSVLAKVEKFDTFLDNVREILNTKKPREVIEYIVKESGLEESLMNKGDDDLERLENIRELATIATKYDDFAAPAGIEQFIYDAALMQEQDTLKDKREGVTLMTVHAAKGLEFDHVFITGLEQDLFPHASLTSDKRDGEEERRLFYVAVTRAKRKLYLSCAQERMIFGKTIASAPSEFLLGIDETLTQAADPFFKDSEIIIE